MNILKLMQRKEKRDKTRRRRQHIRDYYKRKEEELQFYRRMVVEALEADIQKAAKRC